jgi:dipeptidyl aminopeptidase/acylaminoacyl peptidase
MKKVPVLAPVVVALLAVLASCSGSSTDSDASQSTTSSTTPEPTLTFYRPPTVLDSGAPGDVLGAEPLALDPTLPGTGQRITYVSTTPAGDRVPVTGVLIRPLTPPPSGGYPVVVWAHGTTGVGDSCAPSLVSPFPLYGAAALLQAGYAIAAPDYEGLGTPDEIHPYLVGEAEGHNVLDAARAAKSIGGGPITVSWGWSQGGHAALFAAALAHSYAPELDFRGAAVHAPVTNAGTFLTQGITDVTVFPFTAEAILAWSDVYEQTSLTDLVVVQDAERARLAEQACTGDIADNTTRPLDQIFRSDPQNLAVWRSALETNSVPASPIRAPVLLAHGEADALVPISGTDALNQQLCAEGRTVQYLRDPAWDHNGVYLYPMPQFDDWIISRIEGRPAPSSC